MAEIDAQTEDLKPFSDRSPLSLASRSPARRVLISLSLHLAAGALFPNRLLSLDIGGHDGSWRCDYWERLCYLIQDATAQPLLSTYDMYILLS